MNNYYVNILTKEKKYDEALEHYRFMSANKLINFSDLSVAKKMALLNLEANKFEESVAFINSLKKKDINTLIISRVFLILRKIILKKLKII